MSNKTKKRFKAKPIKVKVLAKISTKTSFALSPSGQEPISGNVGVKTTTRLQYKKTTFIVFCVNGVSLAVYRQPIILKIA